MLLNIQIKNFQQVEEMNELIKKDSSRLKDNISEFTQILRRIKSSWDDEGVASESFYNEFMGQIEQITTLGNVLDSYTSTINVLLREYERVSKQVVE